MTRLKRLIIVAVALLGLLSIAEPANAAGVWRERYINNDDFPAGTKGLIRWVSDDCGSDPPDISPGSTGKIREFGMSGVSGFKVQYLYQIPKKIGTGYSTILQSKTYVDKFPDDSVSYEWKVPSHRFGRFVAPDDGRMAVKFTFIRNNSVDTKVTQAAAYC